MKPIYPISLCFALALSFSTIVNAEQKTATVVNNQPISIDADNQEIDIQNNTITFTGNVMVEQGTLKVNANRMTINNVQNKAEQRITAYGTPVKFHQVLANNKLVDGQAETLTYDVKNGIITLQGDAKLTQQDNTIVSQIITYNIAKQQIMAKGNEKSRVKTIIVPNQVTEIK
ncbi:lipopolysaccharide transport periplasmic protein LptA [Utexia brackfieldae]|uniref:lipopolysaccharide transport periplasmic protein LptA n=1 Tax=Utexia brackfieldae TaxID=3074108 RepID=UPI00370D88FF